MKRKLLVVLLAVGVIVCVYWLFDRQRPKLVGTINSVELEDLLIINSELPCDEFNHYVARYSRFHWHLFECRTANRDLEEFLNDFDLTLIGSSKGHVGLFYERGFRLIELDSKLIPIVS